MRNMARLLLLLLLVAPGARADEPTRLGALLRAYFRETGSISRREELLAEVRRVTNDDPAPVAAAIRKGEHRAYPERPALAADGPPPVFEGPSFRYDAHADAIARSAGRYAALVLPPGYDRSRTYALAVDLGAKPRAPEPGVVVLRIDAHKFDDAVTVERLVLGLVAHMMEIARIDPDRVFLRGASTFAELVWYIGFQNPDRFAGLFCGHEFWDGAEEQGSHAGLFSVFAVGNGRNDGAMKRGMGEFGRFSREHRFMVVPRREPQVQERMIAMRTAWQIATTRVEPRGRLSLTCIRPYPLRCHWIRVVPKSRSKREMELGKRWTHHELPRKVRIIAEFDGKERNLVRVKTQNVVAFQLYVDPELFDVDKPVRVSIDGKAPTARLIVPDIGVLLDDYLERGDPKLLYVDRFSFP